MLSVTSLSSYLYCPRKLHLQKVLKIEEPPSPALVLGRISHCLHEEMATREEDVVNQTTGVLSYHQLLKVFNDLLATFLRNKIVEESAELKAFDLDLAEVFCKSWKRILLQIEERVRLIHGFMEREAASGKELWKIISPKIEAEKRIKNKELGLSGIIDKVEVYEERMVPVELKTGKAPRTGVWPGHEAQIGGYLLMMKMAEQPVSTGYVHYLDVNEKRAVHLNPFLVVHIKKLIVDVENVLSEVVPPGRIEQKAKCDACSLREQCYDERFVAEQVEREKRN